MTSAVDVNQDETATDVSTSRPRGDLVRTLLRGVGQTLITMGIVCLLFVVYELWVTDLFAAHEQNRLSQQIEEEWADAPTIGADAPTVTGQVPTPDAPAFTPAAVQAAIGEPFAVLHIPRLALDYSRVIVEGAAQDQLAQGPGHYIGTAMPGEPGNFAVAGHRVGRGSPFLNLDRMRAGDPIVVETSDAWFVYRVLGDPTTGQLDTDPSGIPGMEIVAPTSVSVIAPTPGDASGAVSDAYLTLTTCHPKYSARQRLIIHARLDGAPLSKAVAPDGPPALTG